LAYHIKFTLENFCKAITGFLIQKGYWQRYLVIINLLAEVFGVVVHMVLDEGVDEEVGVGIPFLHPQLNGDVAVGDAGLHKVFREQLLLFVELIVAALINEHMQGRTVVGLEEVTGVVGPPAALVGAEVSRKGLHPPGALGGVADRGEGRDGGEKTGGLQGAHHGTVPSHAVAKDAHLIRDFIVVPDELRQFFCNVGEHAVVLAELVFGGIQVEAGPTPKVPRIVLTLDIAPSWAGVGTHHHNPVPGSMPLRPRLLDEVGFVAGQAGEPEQHGHRALF